MTIEQIAIELSKDDKKITPQNLLKKFDKRKFRFYEIQKILDILGYEMVIEKI